MRNTWDEAKRRITLAERGLDFADAELIFAGLIMDAIRAEGLRRAALHHRRLA
jgi:uncharacterized DUF497 family protein